MQCSVRPYQGYPALWIDDTPIPSTAYITYQPEPQHYQEMYHAGVRLFSLGVYAGGRGISEISGIGPFRPGFYTGENSFDFSAVEQDFISASAGQKDCWLLPRVYLDCPIWWEKSHPEELCRDAAGAPLRQSFASQRWREDMAAALRALMDFVEQSPWKEQVVGYQVAAGNTEEWMYHRRWEQQLSDYSIPAVEGYRQWLKQKYGALERVEAVHRCRYGSWSQVSLATPAERLTCENGCLRNPYREAKTMDFTRWHNHLIADTIGYFCRVIKEHSHGGRITGAFYGYLFELPSLDYGHWGLGEVLSNPDVDFLASPNSYMGLRQPGIDWPSMSVVDSARLHGKLWFIESDTRTHLTGPLKDKRPDILPQNGRYDRKGVWKGPDTYEETCHLLKKGFGSLLTKHLSTWWFDMWGGWFSDPRYLQLLEKFGALLWEQQQRPSAFSAQIAVFVDDCSQHCFGLNSSELAQQLSLQREALGHLGAPYQVFLLDDLTKPGTNWQDFRLCIFLNCVQMRSSTRQAVEHLKGLGRTLLFIGPSDWYQEDGTAQPQPVTGFSTRYDPASAPVQAEYQGEQFPSQPLCCPRFRETEGARVLARFREGGDPAVCLQTSPEGNQVLSLAPNLPSGLLRQCAVLSGVHVYDVSGNIVYADEDHICVHLTHSGWQRLMLPQPREVLDLLTGEPLASGSVSCYDYHGQRHQTFLFRLK